MGHMNTIEIDERMNELEFKLQYQEDVIESLNNALSNQQKEIFILQEKMVNLVKQIESYRTQQTIHEGDTPPHY